ncbi:MAG: SIMPL domain-containing protein [Coriobacteriaceae bacterium]|nr:SIMPL domain-containing protein [Coriobacteriaceae bacterium]
MNAKQLWSVLAVATCAALLAGALAGCSGASASTDSDITVTATSDAKIVPDKARINVSVVSEEKTAEACQKENATRVNAVIGKLGGLGVADTSIQTANTYLFPRYGQPKDGSEDDEYVITGYEMTTTLRVEDLDIDNVGTVIQACVAEGANQADGIEFYASTYDEAYQQALEAALGTARNKAEGIANASGVNLGSIVRVSEGYQDTSARYISNPDVYASEDAVDSGAATAKTMPGQTTITAEVTVTYAIR